MVNSEKGKPIRWDMNTYAIVIHGIVTLATLVIFSIYSLGKLSNWKLTRLSEFSTPAHPIPSSTLITHSELEDPISNIFSAGQSSELGSIAKLHQQKSFDSAKSSYLWSDPENEIMQMFFEHQFPESCEGKKFILYRLDQMLTRNVGSITTQVAHWLGDALISDRILIWGPQTWEMADCPEKDWECYFEPISSCTYNDIPPNYTSLEIYDDIKNNSKYDAITVSIAWRKWWRVLDPHIRQYLKIDPIEFHARAYTFLLRLNPEIKQLVENRMEKLLKSYPDLDPVKTLSIPLRRGDKCKGHHIGHSAPGEDQCIPIQQWIDAINKFRCDDFDCDASKLSSFIITCSEEVVVRNMTKLGKKNNWNVIWNTFDVMQGTGSANDLQAVNATLTAKDVIVSIFTSLQLQLHGKFFVKKKRRRYSSWIMLIEYIMVKIPEATPGKQKVKTINLWQHTKVQPR